MKKLTIILLLLLFASSAWAATYYVRTDGHDTNCAGTHDASDASTETDQCAFLTITKAESVLSATNTATTVYVADGNYTENLTINVDGTSADDRLAFQAANEHQVIINGVVSITGDYVKFDGFKVLLPAQGATALSAEGTYGLVSNNWLGVVEGFDNTWGNVYTTAFGGSNNTIKDNYIEDGCMQVSLSGANHIFQNNELYRPKLYSGCGDADYVRIYGEGHLVKNNYLHGVRADEIGAAHTDGFQSFDNAGQIIKNVIFEDNTIETLNSCWILSMTVNKSADNTGNIIRNNACYVEWNWGLDARYVGVEIYNNTFVIAGSGYFFYNVVDVDPVEPNHYSIVKNNIMVATNQSSVSPSSYNCANKTQGTDCKNNISYAVNYPTRYSAETFTGDQVNVDPKLNSLTDPTQFTLQSDSPAIGAGVDLSATGFSDDLDGTARGAAWDIGAYEYYEQGSIRGVASMGVSKK